MNPIELIKIVAFILGILWSFRSSKNNPVGFVLACFALYFMFPDCLAVIQKLFNIGESWFLDLFKDFVRYFAIGGTFVGAFLALRHSTKK